jgi:hypothetical protein
LGPVYKNVHVFQEKWVPSDPPALSFFAQGGVDLPRDFSSICD